MIELELSERAYFIFTNDSAADSYSLHCIIIVGYNVQVQ